MALSILTRLCEHGRNCTDDIAIREVACDGQPERKASFGQLATLVAAYATTIKQSVRPGEVVIICLPNRIACTVAFLAALRANVVAFLINPSASEHELRAAAIAARAVAIVGSPEAGQSLVDRGVRSLALPAMAETVDSIESETFNVPTESQGSGLMLLSSGTTGDPKIVMRDGPSLDAVACNVAIATRLTSDDCVLGMIPLCHSYGVEHGILAPTYAGCAVHLCQGFDTRVVLDQLATGTITVLPGVPSIFEMLARWGDGTVAFPNVRCAYSAGSQLPMSVFDACQQRLQLRVGQLYGSSEVGSVTFNDPHATGHDPMSTGLPMNDVVVRIVDPETHRIDQPLRPGVEGELAIHSPSMLRGYVGEDAPPARDDFFLTGDLAKVNANGAITITGRTRLLIDVGALKVNPIEVESVLAQHEGVRDCVVVAASVTDTISRVRALIVPKDREHPPSPDSLRQFARSRLSAHKVPRIIDITDSLPKSPTGKILRRQIAS
jgi:long-chain acyl-CoA synthetase